jgi:hypothetical protein
LEFRGLKQTFERRTLRSRKSERALVEMEWSIFAMTVIELFALKQQLPQRKATPVRSSFAKSLRAIRQSLRHLGDRPDHTNDLSTLLRSALIDDYQRRRPKTARYKSTKKDKPSCGLPKVTRATAIHRKKLKQLDLLTAA